MCSIRLASHVRKLFGANATVVHIGPRQPGHDRRWEWVAGLVDEGGAIGKPHNRTATRLPHHGPSLDQFHRRRGVKDGTVATSKGSRSKSKSKSMITSKNISTSMSKNTDEGVKNERRAPRLDKNSGHEATP